MRKRQLDVTLSYNIFVQRHLINGHRHLHQLSFPKRMSGWDYDSVRTWVGPQPSPEKELEKIHGTVNYLQPFVIADTHLRQVSLAVTLKKEDV